MLSFFLPLYSATLTGLLTIEQNNALLSSKVPLKAKATVLDVITKPYPMALNKSLNEIKAMLSKQAINLNEAVLNKTITTLKCARLKNIAHNNILTIIDYSLPSNKKRLWIIDLAKNTLLFHTYVSHGITSGALLSDAFSNKVNSKATSIGVYNTEKAYIGRHGLSLKLIGLDRGFNHNAYRRYIVMHGSWYMDENFIKKYGRPGRSWGCPAVPLHLTKPIIDTIKNNSLFVAYHPGNTWLSTSTFLNCGNLFHKATTPSTIKGKIPFIQAREKILFADINNNNKREEHEPIVTMSADDYQHTFKTTAPLNRMLRRQINQTEYIALTHKELASLDTSTLTHVYFIIPAVKRLRGYWATEMKIVRLGKIKTVNTDTDPLTLHRETKPALHLRSTGRFIRWLGL